MQTRRESVWGKVLFGGVAEIRGRGAGVDLRCPQFQ